MKTSKSFVLFASAGVAAAALTSCIVETPPVQATHTTTTYETAPTTQTRYIQTLPSGYREEVVDGNRYYRTGDVYYRRDGRGYTVVDLPGNRTRQVYDDGTVVTTLPSGARVVNRGATRYYESGGVYYQSRGNGYVVVRNPY